MYSLGVHFLPQTHTHSEKSELLGIAMRMLAVLLVLLAFVACGWCSSVCECDTPQVRAVLNDFFFATAGLDWKNSSGWTTYDPVCSWFGIQCQGANLTSIYLDDNNLNGTLIADLESIPSIREIHLADNHLTGRLPPKWGAMTQIEVIHLNGNRLTEELPVEWRLMSKLERLFLNGNQLTGHATAPLDGIDTPFVAPPWQQPA